MKNFVISSKTLIKILSVLIPLLLCISLFLPIKQQIRQENTYNTCIYSSNGVPLAYVRRNDSSNVACMLDSTKLSKVFKYLIFREDPEFWNQKSFFKSKFYSNYMGVSPRIFFGSGGGSTIAQQTLKNVSTSIFNTNSKKRTMISKLSEIVGAVRLQSLSNTEQLQLYINNVGLANHAYKGELAAIQYFGRPLSELNDKELYLLARSVKSPKIGSILFKDLHKITNDSINELIRVSFNNTIIKNDLSNTDELERILLMPVNFKNKKAVSAENHYVFDIVKPIGLQQEGVGYITTLNSVICNKINNSFVEYAKNVEMNVGKNAYLDANAVVLDINSGNVLGVNTIPLMMDDKGYALNKNQLWASTPIGSLVKPIILSIAFDNSYLNENDMLIDSFRGRIRNYDNKYHGVVTIRETIKKSWNTGIDNLPNRNLIIYKMMESLNSTFGLSKKVNPSQACLGQPILLNPVQVGQIYRALITNGVVKKNKIVYKALDTNVFPYCNIFQPSNNELQFISSKTTANIKKLLDAPLEEGGTLEKAAKVGEGKALFGKSGTTSDYEYGWTVLANDKFLVVVRLNYLHAKSIPIPNKSGGLSAGILAGLILKSL